MKIGIALAALAVVAASASFRSASPPQAGKKANLDVVQWFNSPPISADQLQGHAVLVEVFRTW